MEEAVVDGNTVSAAPEAPEEGLCPACGAEVRKRRVTRMSGKVTYFYRHRLGQGKGCPMRYHPTRRAATTVSEWEHSTK